MKDFAIKYKIIIVTACIVVIGTITLYFYKNIFNKTEDYNYDFFEELSNNNPNQNVLLKEDEIEEKIMVHITGCVKKQGIVVLNRGDRVVDAIDIAGGATEEADLNKINLAYELEDGEKLYIPSKLEEIEQEYLYSGEEKYVSSEYSKGQKDEKININRATQEELQQLNGIGESMANKIVKYREENGKFGTIEDIKKVPGIGDAKFNNFKDVIKVD